MEAGSNAWESRHVTKAKVSPNLYDPLLSPSSLFQMQKTNESIAFLWHIYIAYKYIFGYSVYDRNGILMPDYGTFIQ
ncbi:hypothetical protein CEXT_468621 [Caerostris extrusa]|uniref:Uncharacterized protein n=1 Tax=Caerostris extrusa TaxID=172846 RepID=A0AAV4QW70_CAEEX|nr:hypothetical protein CEXT_468621 [Caerostris extrusa]